MRLLLLSLSRTFCTTYYERTKKNTNKCFVFIIIVGCLYQMYVHVSSKQTLPLHLVYGSRSNRYQIILQHETQIYVKQSDSELSVHKPHGVICVRALHDLATPIHAFRLHCSIQYAVYNIFVRQEIKCPIYFKRYLPKPSCKTHELVNRSKNCLNSPSTSSLMRKYIISVFLAITIFHDIQL